MYIALFLFLFSPLSYFIICMNNYDYHVCLLFFLIYGPNMSSTFIILYMARFLTQWAFHRVQEHTKRSSDEEVMIFRSWRSHAVKPSRADLLWPSSANLSELTFYPPQAYEWILDSMDFSYSPRTPKTKFGRRSYDLPKLEVTRSQTQLS